MKPPKIKSIIPTNREYFAAFLPDKEHNIDSRVEKIVCWSLMEYHGANEPDEVVGQIIDGDTITEVINVDEEEGFGTFLGYFETTEIATTAIMTASAKAGEEEGDEEEEGDDEEEEEDEEGDDADEEEEDDEDDDDDDDDEEEEDDDDDDEEEEED